VQRRLRRSMALGVDRGAIGRPGAGGRWLAAEVPEVVTSDGLKPRVVPQSLIVPHPRVCPLPLDLLRGAWARIRLAASGRPIQGPGYRLRVDMLRSLPRRLAVQSEPDRISAVGIGDELVFPARSRRWQAAALRHLALCCRVALGPTLTVDPLSPMPLIAIRAALDLLLN
jgi:hypothetical protein